MSFGLAWLTAPSSLCDIEKILAEIDNKLAIDFFNETIAPSPKASKFLLDIIYYLLAAAYFALLYSTSLL